MAGEYPSYELSPWFTFLVVTKPLVHLPAYNMKHCLVPMYPAIRMYGRTKPALSSVLLFHLLVFGPVHHFRTFRLVSLPLFPAIT